MDIYFKETEVIKVDLHAMDKNTAERYLENVVKLAPKGTKEIIVIHGYHNGTVLMNMVRKEFHSNKVAGKYLSLNQGITSLILKEN